MKIAFLGDIALIGKYDLSTHNNVFERLLELKNKLNEYDYVIANLESVFTKKSKTIVPKSMHLKSNPINVEILKYLNVSAVTLANNHINDFGAKAIQDTINVLEDNNIEWFGLNNKNIVVKIQNNHISLHGYCCLTTNPTGFRVGKYKVNILNKDKVEKELLENEKNEYLSVLSIHWGREHTNLPNYEHLELVNILSKKFDFIIHGHHPHVLQPITKVNNSYISFSLGNCLFDDMVSINGKKIVKQNEMNRTSLIYELEISDNKIQKESLIGFKEINNIVFFDIKEKIETYNKVLQIKDKNFYNKQRNNQFNSTINEKFGKRNFCWYLSKINYNSMLSVLYGIFNKISYFWLTKKIKDDK